MQIFASLLSSSVCSAPIAMPKDHSPMRTVDETCPNESLQKPALHRSSFDRPILPRFIIIDINQPKSASQYTIEPLGVLLSACFVLAVLKVCKRSPPAPVAGSSPRTGCSNANPVSYKYLPTCFSAGVT
jgi:hypothetical protein